MKPRRAEPLPNPKKPRRPKSNGSGKKNTPLPYPYTPGGKKIAPLPNPRFPNPKKPAKGSKPGGPNIRPYGQ